MLFSNASSSTAEAIMGLFAKFSSFSGLQLNLEISQLFTNGNGSSFSSILGIPEQVFPVRYLGVPLFHGALTHSMCMPLIDKMRNKVQARSGYMLSKAGKVELIKSFLSSFNVFWTSEFSLPKNTIHTLEKIMRQFLWTGVGNARKQHQLSWSTICTPIKEGGLGIKRISDWNLAAMGMRFWELASGHVSLWAKWMKLKYFTKAPFGSASHPCWWWRTPADANADTNERLRCYVKNLHIPCRIRFSDDLSRVPRRLKTMISPPRVFSLAFCPSRTPATRIQTEPKRSIWTTHPSSSSSWAWKCIIKSREWIQKDVHFIIFEGLSINLWDDPWLNGFGLRHHFRGTGTLL
ncbi:putative ribonuclease H protein [Acorus calamus]|uniref:Ribonuclease H protein n=1 Tax=Acorus calamus TaxID=4465 RepID=A0AAV9EXS2_ACOCL|nr:putative ribonuclease H protein [Acorus calamus]